MPIRSLEVVVLQRGIESYLDDFFVTPSDVLQKLSILRQVGSLRIQDAQIDSLPGYTLWEDVKSCVPELARFDSDEHTELVKLVTGNSPFEAAFEMYKSLLKYVQLFERYAPFQIETAFHNPFPPNPEHYGQQYDAFKKSKVLNPYKGYGRDPHPVEQALRQASDASEEQDVAKFKLHREIALEYLESQYQRMSAASTNVLQFIKREKRVDGLFAYIEAANVYTPEYRKKFVEALILIEDYAKTWERDMPLEVRKIIRDNGQQFEGIYMQTCTYQSLRFLNFAFEMGDLEACIDTFKKIFVALDNNYRAIMKARNFLFKWDVTGRCCKLEVENKTYKEKIDWDVDEPDVTAQPQEIETEDRV